MVRSKILAVRKDLTPIGRTSELQSDYQRGYEIT